MGRLAKPRSWRDQEQERQHRWAEQHGVRDQQILLNLFEGIRESVLEYGENHKVRWHRYSGHPRSSQACCLNFLAGIAHNKQALISVLRTAIPEVVDVLPFPEKPGFGYLAFEWAGSDPGVLMNEPARGRHQSTKASTRKRTRGALITSSDAAVLVRHSKRDKPCLVLIEWKFTEGDREEEPVAERTKRNQMNCYREFLQIPDHPFVLDHLGNDFEQSYEQLFHPDAYQLFRAQLLAYRSLSDQALGPLDGAICLHVSPAQNDALRAKPAPWSAAGRPLFACWPDILKDRSSFISSTVQELFGEFPIGRFPDLEPWWKYITSRYGSLIEPIKKQA
jgi:hypothetical protein